MSVTKIFKLPFTKVQHEARTGEIGVTANNLIAVLNLGDVREVHIDEVNKTPVGVYQTEKTVQQILDDVNATGYTQNGFVEVTFIKGRSHTFKTPIPGLLNTDKVAQCLRRDPSGTKVHVDNHNQKNYRENVVYEVEEDLVEWDRAVPYY